LQAHRGLSDRYPAWPVVPAAAAGNLDPVVQADALHRPGQDLRFFHTLKTELVHHRTYTTRDEAKRDLFSYMEEFYNRRRLHSSLGYRTPVQAEQRALRVA